MSSWPKLGTAQPQLVVYGTQGVQSSFVAKSQCERIKLAFRVQKFCLKTFINFAGCIKLSYDSSFYTLLVRNKDFSELVRKYLKRQKPIQPRKGGYNPPPMSENRYYSGTKHPVDLSSVCKLIFVRCGPKKKKRLLTLYLIVVLK